VSGREREPVVVDAPSFARFYPDAYDEVYRALALTLRNPELTADAVQEALARAYARWDQVSGYANPTGWVYRVALNWARSRWRRLARETLTRRLPERQAPALPPPAHPGVARALPALPRGKRAVVVLRLYLDWPVAEVASALQVSPGTVKSRLARALERLREHLEVDDED
jgi:RNA polymerase sigma-70 factor (sigma-E family)